MNPPAQPTDMNHIMARFTNRRSGKTLPRENARAGFVDHTFSADGDFAARGGGGGGAAMEAWRLPPRKVWRGVVVYGQVKRRLCTIVESGGAQ